MRRLSVDIAKFIAIVSVVLYHFYPEIFNSGFLGVELFLFVTGFLSAKSLKKQSSWVFIKKRFLRIYPSLAVHLLIFLSLLIFVAIDSELYVNFKLSLFSNLLLSNIYLLLTSSDYFADTTSLLFMHNWSIGLEFQIWVVLGILALLGKHSNNFIGLLGLFGIVYAIGLVEQEVYYSQYFNPLRLVGLAFAGYWIGSFGYSVNVKISQYILVVFLISFLCVFSIDFNLFLYVIVVLFGGASLLVSVEAEGKIANLVQWVSDHTYGIYLYHYPVLILLRNYYGIDNYAVLTVIVTLFLARISRKYFENV